MANHFKVKKNKITPLEVERTKESDISSAKTNYTNRDKSQGQTSKSQQNTSKLINKLNDDNQSSRHELPATKVDKNYTYRQNDTANDTTSAQPDVVHKDISQQVASQTHPNLHDLCPGRSDVTDVQIKGNLHSGVTGVMDVSIRDVSHQTDIGNGIVKNKSNEVNENMVVSPKTTATSENPSIVPIDGDQTFEVTCPCSETNSTQGESVLSPKIVTISTTEDINDNVNSGTTSSDVNIINKSMEEGTCRLPKKEQSNFTSLSVPETEMSKSPLKSEIQIYDIDGNVESVTKNENNFAGSVCLMNSKNREKGRRKVEVRAAKKIAILIGAFMFCWLPLPSLVIGTMNILPLSLVQHQVLVVCGTIATASIAVNPLLYALLNKPINSAMKTMYFQNRLFKNKW